MGGETVHTVGQDDHWDRRPQDHAPEDQPVSALGLVVLHHVVVRPQDPDEVQQREDHGQRHPGARRPVVAAVVPQGGQRHSEGAEPKQDAVQIPRARTVPGLPANDCHQSAEEEGEGDVAELAQRSRQEASHLGVAGLPHGAINAGVLRRHRSRGRGGPGGCHGRRAAAAAAAVGCAPGDGAGGAAGGMGAHLEVASSRRTTTQQRSRVGKILPALAEDPGVVRLGGRACNSLAHQGRHVGCLTVHMSVPRGDRAEELRSVDRAVPHQVTTVHDPLDLLQGNWDAVVKGSQELLDLVQIKASRLIRVELCEKAEDRIVKVPVALPSAEGEMELDKADRAIEVRVREPQHEVEFLVGRWPPVVEVPEQLAELVLLEDARTITVVRREELLDLDLAGIPTVPGPEPRVSHAASRRRFQPGSPAEAPRGGGGAASASAAEGPAPLTIVRRRTTCSPSQSRRNLARLYILDARVRNDLDTTSKQRVAVHTAIRGVDLLDDPRQPRLR
mmetsp:Transcript_82720/g.208134  ORF Transcript_82720/g.208134 Transcript_82720/m.208134 type:complete len:503 (-) Transcript_82720:260-1768(-)